MGRRSQGGIKINRISKELINLISRVQELSKKYNTVIKLYGSLEKFYIEIIDADEMTIFSIKIELLEFGTIAEQKMDYINKVTTITYIKRADE